jgi:hypothetical protein
MRFAVGLSVIALGAILAFGVTSSPDAVNIQVIGVIFILVGLAGLALAQWLYTTRRRTDVIYHRDGVTLLEPNTPAPEGSVEAVETHGEPVEEREVDNLPPDGPAMPPAPEIVPGARIVNEPKGNRVRHIEGVMDAEPGTEEFLHMQRDWM